MIDKTDLRICTECKIHHYENCPKCFGFGVFENGTPVIASEAHYKTFTRPVVPCPYCGSGIDGVATGVSA